MELSKIVLENADILLEIKQGTFERLMAGPSRISRQFSAILGAKRLPKRRPRGIKFEFQRRLELKIAKPQNLMNVSQNSLIFKVPSFVFGRQIDTKCVLVA